MLACWAESTLPGLRAHGRTEPAVLQAGRFQDTRLIPMMFTGLNLVALMSQNGKESA